MKKHSHFSIASLEGLNVLVAEDNNLNRLIVSEYLELCNMTCDCVVDGQECIDRLIASPENYYDLVVMDIQMPRLDGLEATKIIRQSSRPDIRSIPIVALSADNFAEDISACRAVGMNGHISKPIDIDKLKNELMRVLTAQGETDKREGEQVPLEEVEIFSYEKLYALFGSDETIKKLLISFLTAHQDDCDALRGCLDTENYEDARPILHNLIGVSGNFCMQRLCEASKKLRLQVHAKEVNCFDEFSAIWDKTVAELCEVCERLNRTE